MTTTNRNKHPSHNCSRFAVCFGAALAVSASLAAESMFDRQHAEAQPHKDSLSQGQTSRRDFVFGDGRALLRKDGTWQVEAVISHGGLRCGDYRLGVRFGIGQRGCQDVTWLSEPIFSTRLKHCNNAERPHRGDGYDALLSDAFERISCAERLIKCTGLCRAPSPGQVEPAPSFGD